MGVDFFPLTCDYRERTAAAGKFPGGFIKREGRPTTKETLTSRLIDRPVRPLFPVGFHDEVQIQAMVLSSDRQYDPDVLAMNGASAALCISPLPFQGPIAAVRLGQINGEFVVFPTQDQLEESDLDLIVSGSKDAILMIEGFAREMQEDRMAEAIFEAHGYIREICDLQSELARKCNVEKAHFEPEPDDGLFDKLKGRYFAEFKQAKSTEGKQNRAEAVKTLKERIVSEMIPDPKAADADCCCEVAERAQPAGRARGPRADPLGTPPGRSRQQLAARARLPGRRAAARARLGGVPARRNAGAGHRHSRHGARRAARGRPDRRILQEVHARLQLPAVLGRRDQADPRAWPARNRPRHAGRAEREERCFPNPTSFPTRFA